MGRTNTTTKSEGDLDAELTDAMMKVARAAADVSERAVESRRGGFTAFTVDAEDMADLREALAEWSAAGQALLRGIRG
jgi:hypothetical protein